MHRRRSFSQWLLSGIGRTALVGSLLATGALAVPIPASAAPDPGAGTTPTSPSPTPSPTPTPTPQPPSPPPTSATPASPSASNSTPTSTKSTTPPTPAHTARSNTVRTGQQQAASTGRSVSLSVKAGGTPVANRYFEDIGTFNFSGAVTGSRTATVWFNNSGRWVRAATETANSSGNWTAVKKVTHATTWHFIATLGTTSPTSSSAVKSSEVSVDVHPEEVYLHNPPKTLDALKNTKVTGWVVPAMAGVGLHFQVRERNRAWTTVKTVETTTKDGTFTFTFSNGNGLIRDYSVRARHWDGRGHTSIISGAKPIERVKRLDPVVTPTTAAEVADTYHSGCPVGPSKLRTIRMDYYGLDQRMHRGLIIVAAGRVKSVEQSFSIALKAGFRIRRMTNPNHWGGSDTRQMEADNSSAFNCRKVTGNPYAESPHSYGIAIDVNTRENPYHAANGTWYPSDGKAYIKRSPWRRGMLRASSPLTKAFRARGYFWGGFWSPGTDYQHFEYDG